MSKYLAVIKDSFREALASRVLWLVLVGISLLLFFMAPLGFHEVLTTRLSDEDFRSVDNFVVVIREQGPVEGRTPAHHVWKQFDQKLKDRFANVKVPGKDSGAANPFEFIGVANDLRRSLNKQIERVDFYDQAAWTGITIPSDEARELLRRHEGRGKEPKKLSSNEVARMNRLLLEAAFPEEIRVSPPTSIQFRYAWWDAGSPQPLRGSTLREAIQSLGATVMSFFVGVIGVFVAILVTAPIIPQMFDAGALHLLLSKPVSRWLLFLAKFVGGCAFISIAAVYLIGGVWLILGVRFGVWESKLWLSLPIYLFVFSIYYSVSALAAVIWRSPIVSIALSILFWLMCFIVGLLKGGYESVFMNKERFTRVLMAKDTLIAADEFGWGSEWDAKEQRWLTRFVLPEQRQARPFLSLAPAVPREFRTIGPIYDEAGDRLLAGIPAFPPTKIHFAVGARNNKWEPTTKLSAPLGTFAVLREPSGKILVVSSLGLSRLVGDPLAKSEPVKAFGLTLPFPGSNPFQNANPDPAVLLTQPATAALNSKSGELALYSRSTITILGPKKNKYEKLRQHKLDGKERQSAVLAFGGQHLIVGREDGRLQVLAAASLKLLHEWKPEGPNPLRFAEASADGRWFAMVFHTGRLWLFDAEASELTRPRVTGQGNISAANFAGNRLLVVDRTDRVTEYSLSPVKVERRFSPNSGLLLTGYRFGLVPLYTVFPKPGQLDETFNYLLSGKETEKAERDSDLASAQKIIDPWSPVWSSAVFTLIMLVVACFYIEWQEF